MDKINDYWIKFYNFSFKEIITFFKRIKLYQKILLLIFPFIILIITIIRGLEQDSNGDFFVFYNAGINFFSNAKLYFLEGIERQFLYPPFAALVFGIFCILPFKISAMLWALSEIVLWYYCILLSKKIIEINSNLKINTSIIILSIIFTFNIYLDNLSLLQVNSFVFFLILLSIYCFSLNKVKLSSLFLSIAIGIKVTPVFFFIWFVIAKKWKYLLFSTIFLFIIFTIPVLIRGFEQGIGDLHLFYLNLLHEFPKIEADAGYSTSLSLRGLIINYLQIFKIESTELSSVIINSIQLSFITAFMIWVYSLRNFEFETKNFQIAGMLLLMVLTSAVTRKAHLVTLFFVYLTALSYCQYLIKLKNIKYLQFMIYFIGTIFFISGRDIIGNFYAELLYKYGIYNILTVLLFFIIMRLSYISSGKVLNYKQNINT